MGVYWGIEFWYFIGWLVMYVLHRKKFLNCQTILEISPRFQNICMNCAELSHNSPPEYAIFVKLSKNGYIFKKLIWILQILNTIYRIRANCQIICIFGLCTMKYIHVFKCTSKYNKIHRCILKYQDIHWCISIYIDVFVCISW